MPPKISFEFSPPKTIAGEEELAQTYTKFYAYQPSYFSVTYGAAGGSRERTVKTVLKMRQYHLPVVPHLSCIGTSKEEILSLLSLYLEKGIKRLVVLRGDVPARQPAVVQEFQHANELVRFIRNHTGHTFWIDVAAYPEFHPESESFETCLFHFKQKVAAGANGAITQYFFNPESYYRFIDACERLGVIIPIVPGIMPITGVDQLLRFSQFCGADIPLWLRKRLLVYQNKPDSLFSFGIEVITRLCEQLLQNDAPGLHFYTMNKREPMCSILSHLGIEAARQTDNAALNLFAQGVR